mmetsp:Transcript_31150/g.86965  ORF Transcript_31150/g.86965 Transcript_31150/m.86965 type:complete len:94 (+) Transcript_31150:43-324(+)
MGQGPRFSIGASRASALPRARARTAAVSQSRRSGALPPTLRSNTWLESPGSQSQQRLRRKDFVENLDGSVRDPLVGGGRGPRGVLPGRERRVL